MPSPFSQKKTNGPHTKGSEETLAVTNSSLVCEFCFGESTEGMYMPQAKRLFWKCVHCEKTNAVKDIEL